MGVIQSSINSAIQSAGYLSKLKGIEKNVQGLKEYTKDIPGQIESLKTSRQQEKDYNTLAKVEETAYKKYMKKANSIKLSASLKEKVRNGDYNINDYSSKQQELIQEYQNWYDKAQESLIAKQ